MHFLEKIMGKVKNLEPGKENLSEKDFWDFFFYSFFFSRGNSALQSYLFRFLVSNFSESSLKKIDLESPGKRNEMEERIVTFRSKSKLHPEINLNAGVLFESTKESIRGEIKEFKNILFFNSNNNESFSYSEILNYTAASLLAMDFYWVVEKGRNNSHLEQFFVNKKTIPGGPVFKKLQTELKPVLDQLLQSNEWPQPTGFIKKRTTIIPAPIFYDGPKDAWDKILKQLNKK